MKSFIALLSALVIYSSLRAQQPVAADTKPDALPEKPAASDAVNPPLDEPVRLIPETPPTIEKPGSSSGPGMLPVPVESTEATIKKAKTAAAADALKERIHFREIETRAIKDAKVQELYHLAQTAKTDPEKRALLKRYYTMLFGRMLQLDGSLKEQIKLRENDAIHRLEQPKVNEYDRAQN